MLGLICQLRAQRIAWPIRKPRNNADECHCAETRRDGAFRAICVVAPLARGACHGRRVASRISSRKASVAATRDLFRGSIEARMLESAEIGHRVTREAYAREERKLRAALLNAQYDLSQSGRGPVLLIISGVEAGARAQTTTNPPQSLHHPPIPPPPSPP